jgi:hypothetical protein
MPYPPSDVEYGSAGRQLPAPISKRWSADPCACTDKVLSNGLVAIRLVGHSGAKHIKPNLIDVDLGNACELLFSWRVVGIPYK